MKFLMKIVFDRNQCIMSFISTVSSGINSLTAIILEDVIKKIKADIPDSNATTLMKIIGKFFIL